MSAQNYSDELIRSLQNKNCELLSGLETAELVESGKNGDQYACTDESGREFLIRVYETSRDRAEDCASETELLAFLKTKHVVRINGWEYVKLSKKRGCLVTGTERLEPTEIPVSAQEAVKLGTQLAFALEECHRTGLLHLTITPADILSHDGTYMLDGFGTVRIDPSPNGFSAPEYAAAAEFDHRADIYSLALSIFALLGGDVEEAPKLETCPQGCPEKLFAVLKKACAKDPDERYSFARAFGKALESSLNDGEDEEETTQETEDIYEGNDGSTVFADEDSDNEDADASESFDDEEDIDDEEESEDPDSEDDEEIDGEDDEENSDGDDDEEIDGEDDEEDPDGEEADGEPYGACVDMTSDDGSSESPESESPESETPESETPERWESVRCSKGRAALDIIIMILAALLIMAIPALLYYFKNH